MQWNKVRTTFILLLLAVNVILAGSIILHMVQDQKMLKETEKNVTTVLSARGVTCGDKIFLQRKHWLTSGKILLDSEEMHTFAQSFFDGDYTEKQNGEQIILVSQDKKMISFDVNGVFSGTLKTDFPDTVSAAEKKVDSWLKGQVDGDSYRIEGEKNEENYMVRVYRELDGVQVEEPLQFSFLLDGTVTVNGRWIFGTWEKSGKGKDSRDDLPGSLLKFLNQVAGVKKVERADACYCLVSSNGKVLQIEPGWHWETDAGDYLTSTKSDYFVSVE